MADAKITLTTEAKNEGLEKLNKALAEGQQEVASMKKQLKDLAKATKDGTEATKEQADAMVNLRKQINQQSAANKEYAKDIGKTTAEIKKSVKEMADADKGARGLASAFKMTEGFTTAFSVAIGSLAANIAGAAVSAMAELAGQVVNLGAQMQQSVAHMAAMTGGTASATEAYRALNDVYRSTTFDEQAVFNMGQQLMRMGYSAQNAAGLIKICADAAAGLGTGQQGAQQLVDAISRMQAVGELTSRQMTQLKMAGVDMDAAFASLGMTGEQAMKAVEDGTLDAQRAIQALTDYLSQYDGKMAESKNNTIDAWADVTGNLATMCAEIGNSIFDAFNQSEIVQKLIDFTQALVDMVRSDACGAFTDLKTIASEVLNFIGGLLGAVLDIIKLIIIAVHDAYAAFRSFGSQVVEAIRPAVDAVISLYNAIKAVMASVGAAMHSEVAASWGATFGVDPDDPGNISVLGGGNNFKPRAIGGGGGAVIRSGGGGGGASSTARAEAEAKREAEKAAEAAKKAYEESFKSIYDAMQDDSKTLLGAFLGDPNSTRAKIAAIRDQMIADMETIDKAAAMSVNEGNVNVLAAVLGKDAVALQEELTSKGQTIADYCAKIKNGILEVADAQARSVVSADQWHKAMTGYALDVADSMADAFTDIITGAKSGSEALADMAKSIIKNAVQILTKWLSVYAIFSAFGSLTSRSGYSAVDMANMVVFGVRKAMGGLITGPGTGTSDSIPAMLSNGEYVLRSSAVDRIGVARLDAMNRGRHFADGGYVGSGGGWGGAPVVINLHNESGIPMEAEQNESQFDGESYVIGVVLNAVATNKMGMGSLLKGARA